MKLSRIFKMVPEDLFPEHLYQLTTTKAVVEVEPMMLPIGRSVLNLPAPEDPVDDRFKREINEHLAKLICGLSSREEKVIRMKYGIREDREHTLEEIGEYFRITAGRVHQIESKALRKLRHPSRSNKLRSWLETKKGE